ncbi:hypothetical protein [Cohnella terricola]|uniref:Uncharacterized protein n=1 Tax=Cohnella terricola TaxID=1289167 RepID=A0A559JJ43_9BACL|nr:hypothetical protein [Cohnella terricola]TVX99895.1 hypothetical protein FPZ45_13285 [Cohnella terricola]
MNNLSKPHWYYDLEKDQPVRTRIFTEELAARIYSKALKMPARRSFLLNKQKMFGAVMIVAAVCVLSLTMNFPKLNVAPASPSKAEGVADALTPQFRDTLINHSGNAEPQRQILLEERINNNFVLIYSSLPKTTSSSELYMDLLKWTDYGGDRSIGTGLDGWSHAFGSSAAEGTKPLVVSGVSWGDIEFPLGTYGVLSIFTGELFQSNIASIRVVDGSGKQWKAHIFPSSDGTRYWFTDMLGSVKDFKIEALDEHGTVLSTHSRKEP